MWSRLSAVFEGEGVVASQTNATLEDVNKGRTTVREKKGNDQADRYAKLGAKTHPWSDDVLDTLAACELVFKKRVKWAAE